MKIEKAIEELKNNDKVMEENGTVYEIVGIKDGLAVTYKSGTIDQICEDEMLNEVKHENIHDVLKDMDIFSEYKHYAKRN